MTEFVRRLSVSFVMGSSLMHLFCCGIPLLMSVGSLAALVGVTGGELLPMSWFAQWEVTIFVVSGALLLLTGVLQWISYVIDCRKQGRCTHEPCDGKKKLAHNIFYGAVILYLVNVGVFLFAHDMLAHSH